MSEKLKKLKNKKKDIISINPLEMAAKNPLKNNFKDKTKEELREEKKKIIENKINAQPLSSKQMTLFEKNKPKMNISNSQGSFFLPEDKNSIFLLNKIASQLEYLFSYNDIVDDKIVKLITPLLTVNNYNNILEERETLNICGNFLCGVEIKGKIKEGIFSYDKITKKFDTNHVSNIFCSKKCFDVFQNFVKLSLKNKENKDIFLLDNILIFEALQDYYEKDDELTRISQLGDNLIQTFIRSHKNEENEIKKYCNNKRIELTKLFVDDFDKVLKEKMI